MEMISISLAPKSHRDFGIQKHRHTNNCAVPLLLRHRIVAHVPLWVTELVGRYTSKPGTDVQCNVRLMVN